MKPLTTAGELKTSWWLTTATNVGRQRQRRLQRDCQHRH